MIIARQKFKENIIEYLLYMWQIEDLIRAHNFNIDAIYEKVIKQFPEQYHTEMKEWYQVLIDKMIAENVKIKGHISDLTYILSELNQLHNMLLTVFNDEKYRFLYQNAAPYIDELKNKTLEKTKSDVEICLLGLYGVYLLRLKKQNVSEATRKSTETFSKMLAYLNKKYFEMKSGNLHLNLN
jgi:hypothetical protein